MSIGKNSIARAAASNSAVCVQTVKKNSDLAMAKFATGQIGKLAVAQQYTPDSLTDIKKSIENHGILCPLLVAVTPKNEIWLVDGYRRLCSAEQLGITELNAVVIQVKSKTDANRLYKEINSLKPTLVNDGLSEQKFNILAVKDHDLPEYLL